MSDPIEIVGLKKQFKEFVAVNDLTFKVRKNSFTGFLGPNGAGKSTTLKILTNLIKATSGNAYLNGIDVTVDAKNALKGVGTVVETPEFYPYLTPIQTFQYMGGLFGMTRESIADQTAGILEEMKMSEWADKKIGTFSKGMKQRISIGLSMLNDPSIIILDEPTSGLDPRGMAETREILKNLRKKHNDLTILMSSHMLHEVSDMCDRIAMINHGTMLLEGNIEDVLGANSVRNISVKVVGGATKGDADIISGMSNVKDVTYGGNT
ncbi:MAG: ABC transporter ATP-binding protein, partial [Candidatus Methanomethylophilaceae archaeon]|nr:ABC transporter ATP-binding protein [Candidatus Methanomethylophilaceae archaeon]